MLHARSLITFALLTLSVGCGALDTQFENIEEDVRERFTLPTDPACGELHDCLVEVCVPDLDAHEADEAARFRGCLDYCVEAGDTLADEVHQTDAWLLWRCEAGAVEWSDECTELAGYCRGE